jgi:hypothetical protein
MISLLLPFLANCTKTPLPSEPPEPPSIREFDRTRPNMTPSIFISKDLEKERAALETWRLNLERAKASKTINESAYQQGIKKYDQRLRKNKEIFEKLRLGN